MYSISNGYNGTSSSADYEEVKVYVPWGYIAGKWWGPRNVQPVIAIHGWQDNACTFDTLAPMLVKAGISVFCIDLPGHGHSSHYPEGQFYYVLWDGLQIVRRLVRYFKWQQIILLGHSLGGAISFLYASVFPNDINKYICIDIASPLVRDPVKLLSQMGNTIDKFLSYENLTPDQQPCYDYNEMIDVVVGAYNGSVTRKSCEIMMKRGMKPVKTDNTFLFARDVRLKAAGVAFMTLDQVLMFAERIKCEVLNIKADPGMQYDKPEYHDTVMDKIKETASRVECHFIPGTHHIHLNDPEKIAPLIIDFIKL